MIHTDLAISVVVDGIFAVDSERIVPATDAEVYDSHKTRENAMGTAGRAERRSISCATNQTKP
jgi:hypothetical protein